MDSVRREWTGGDLGVFGWCVFSMGWFRRRGRRQEAKGLTDWRFAPCNASFCLYRALLSSRRCILPEYPFCPLYSHCLWPFPFVTCFCLWVYNLTSIVIPFFFHLCPPSTPFHHHLQPPDVLAVPTSICTGPSPLGFGHYTANAQHAAALRLHPHVTATRKHSPVQFSLFLSLYVSYIHVCSVPVQVGLARPLTYPSPNSCCQWPVGSCGRLEAFLIRLYPSLLSLAPAPGLSAHPTYRLLFFALYHLFTVVMTFAFASSAGADDHDNSNSHIQDHPGSRNSVDSDRPEPEDISDSIEKMDNENNHPSHNHQTILMFPSLASADSYSSAYPNQPPPPPPPPPQQQQQ